MNLKVFCDGGSRGNPGPAASAFLVYDSNGTILHSQGLYLGTTTNNQAEYRAVIEALKWLISSPYNRPQTSVTFILDSELIVKQINGLYKIKDGGLQLRYSQVEELSKELQVPTKTFTHVLREHNKQADLLVNQTLDSSV